jgi:hypothetical protein
MFGIYIIEGGVMPMPHVCIGDFGDFDQANEAAKYVALGARVEVSKTNERHQGTPPAKYCVCIHRWYELLGKSLLLKRPKSNDLDSC